MTVYQQATGTPMRRQLGFSLIESMVALVVLSVGMIGIAALYGQGLSAGRTAQFRTQAANLVADMADRIRVNRLGQVDYGGAAANGGCEPPGVAICAPSVMAAHDLFIWNQQVAQLLPNGVGQVQFNNATDPASFTIQVSWDEVGLGNISHTVVIQVPDI